NIGKRKGARVNVQLQTDDTFTIEPPAELLECLQDEPAAMAFFQKLTKGHQAYFIKWIASAKTDQTKTKRMAQMITDLSKGLGSSISQFPNFPISQFPNACSILIVRTS